MSPFLYYVFVNSFQLNTEISVAVSSFPTNYQELERSDPGP